MINRALFFLVAAPTVAFTATRFFPWLGRRPTAPAARSVGGPNLLRIGRTPPRTVDSSATVMEVVRSMDKGEPEAVVVVDDDEVHGILTERDVMLRVTALQKDPGTTPVRDVMTSPVLTVDNASTPDEALKLMLSKRIRHLPILGKSQKVEGMLSLTHLLAAKSERLELELDSLLAYVSADGIGG